MNYVVFFDAADSFVPARLPFAAAFVVAAAGVPVAKHGNVGVTTKAGSADVLGALGVKVDLPPERAGEIFDEIGVCFMFAPLHHAATKRVAMVRRARAGCQGICERRQQGR